MNAHPKFSYHRKDFYRAFLTPFPHLYAIDRAIPEKFALREGSDTLDAPISEKFGKAWNFPQLELYNSSDTGSS